MSAAFDKVIADTKAFYESHKEICDELAKSSDRITRYNARWIQAVAGVI